MRSLLVITIVGVSLILGEKRFIDLTHTFGNSTRDVNWPILPPFNFSLVSSTPINDSIVFVLNQFQTAEHFGTHIDAPYHFCTQGKSVHEITLDKLSGPGVVLDLKSQAKENYDFSVTLQNILDWEKEHGDIPEGAIVLFNFGWYKHWPDPQKVFGTKDVSNMSSFHFPGVGIEAAKHLSETRKVKALGVDSPSAELNPNGYPVHINFLCQHGLVILENVNNLDAMPATGTHVYIGVAKLENGGGAPARMFAVADDEGKLNTARKERLIDLTHTFGGSTRRVNWPINPLFNFSLVSSYDIEVDIVMVLYKFQTAEHFGTHVDAPYHFCTQGKFVHEITLDKLSGPGVVLDFKSQARENYDFRVTRQNILDWEKKHGDIPEGAIVLFNFGWYKHWPDPQKVFGTKDVSNMSSFHFPGVGIEAVKHLSETRKVKALGVDSPSPELNPHGFPVHINFLCEHGLVILENVNNLDAMPASGSFVYVAALKLENGGGTPVRLFASAALPDDGAENPNGARMITPHRFHIILILSTIMMFFMKIPVLCV